VAADHTTAADGDAETVEEPPAPERRPLADLPGADGAPSRAESRAGAIAANDGASQQTDTTRGENKPETAGPSGESSVEQGDKSVDERATSSATAEDAAGDSDGEDPGNDDQSMEDGALDDLGMVLEDEEPIETIGGPPNGAERAASRLEPLNDVEYAEHRDEIGKKIAQALEKGRTTDSLHTIDGRGKVWTLERDKLHADIVDSLYNEAAHVSNGGHAVIAGGLGGAGKSTVLANFAGIDQSQYLAINPDDIKEELARRGAIPVVEGLSPMEASALVHEESSHIAKRLAQRAYDDGKNIIWDITMAKSSSVEGRIQDLRSADYEIEAIFVDIPVEKSVERALARHRHGHEDYRNGEGFGGRYVPPNVIRENFDSTHGSENRRVFEELKSEFDRWVVYDNSVDGRDPILVESSVDKEMK
jgi:predicted ABC-type ATPase